MDKVRLSAKFWTFLEVIPNVAVVVVLLLGALGVGRGDLTPGTLVAFITLMLSLVWPIAALGYILAMAQEAMTAAARILEIFDTEPSIASGARVLDRPRGHLRLEGVGVRVPRPARRAGAARRRPRRRARARRSPSSARPAPARPR